VQNIIWHATHFESGSWYIDELRMAMEYESSTKRALSIRPEFSQPSEEGCRGVDLTDILRRLRRR
jgi:hypothetical protein